MLTSKPWHHKVWNVMTSSTNVYMWRRFRTQTCWSTCCQWDTVISCSNHASFKFLQTLCKSTQTMKTYFSVSRSDIHSLAVTFDLGQGRLGFDLFLLIRFPSTLENSAVPLKSWQKLCRCSTFRASTWCCCMTTRWIWESTGRTNTRIVCN